MANDNSRVAVYTGSFDPITLGHLNVIQRGSRLVDRLIVGIGINPGKDAMFSTEERVELVRRVTAPLTTWKSAPSPGWPSISSANAGPTSCCAAFAH